MIIAIDFDGTIVENKYPKMGKEMTFATEALKMLQQRGYRLILWTCRCGDDLDEALDFCAKRGLFFYAVNKNYPEEVLDDTVSRKINANLFIDDRNFGVFPSWTDIYNSITGESMPKIPKSKGFFSRLI